MSRRRFLGTASATAVLVSFVTSARESGKVARLGYLYAGTERANERKAFVVGLQALGWNEGKNLTIEYRLQQSGKPAIAVLAADMVRRPLDAIFAVNTPAALAVKQTGTRVPVVFAAVSEPVATGLAESLSRPGRNFTGLTTINRELMPKRLEILKDILPRVARVAYLANPAYEVHKAQLAEMEAAGTRLGLVLQLEEVGLVSGLDAAFARIIAGRAGALIVQQDNLFSSNRSAIIEFAARQRLPAMYPFSFFPRAGGLVSYGANAEDLSRRAATYVDRILRGASPAELPIERPDKFELVINPKTAEAIGLTIPEALRLRAEFV